MKRIIVAGIGSRIMQDDGIGLYLAEDLSKCFNRPEIEWIVGETDMDYCLSEMVQADFVILLDAALTGKSPGEITLFDLSALREATGLGCSMHGMHLLDLLPVMEKQPEGFLLGIEPCRIDYGFDLSETLKSKYPDILEQVGQKINELIKQFGGEGHA